GQLDDGVVDVRVVVLQGAVDPVALDGHRGAAGAERLTTPARVDLVGQGEVPGGDVLLQVLQGRQDFGGVRGRLGGILVEPPAAVADDERAGPVDAGGDHQPDLVAGGELLRDLGQLLVGRRVVVLGEPGRLPRL